MPRVAAAASDRRTAPGRENLDFTGETLRILRGETEGRATLLGFVGSPWTLAAYAIEGGASRHCHETKAMMMADDGKLAHKLLDAIADAIGEYCCYQVRRDDDDGRYPRDPQHHHPRTLLGESRAGL